MKITGDERHKARLRRMRSPAVRRQISQGLFVAGGEVQATARLLISEGSSSEGRHVPSKPGEPPNMDTGHLMANIEVVRIAPLTVHVESKAEYAVPLEAGTSKMAARPYMAPALKLKRNRILELTHGVVEASIQGG